MSDRFYQAGQESAERGEFRASPIKRDMFESTREWLDALKEWERGYDDATRADRNPALTRRGSRRGAFHNPRASHIP